MASIYTEIQLEHYDSIRILELAPLDPSISTSLLRGSLISARLNQNTTYTALSYVWGPPEYTHSISLNDSYALPITETLFDALKELASDKAYSGGLSLWIDQVCINQTNESEKTSQVQMMSKIFSQARLVIGWLGPAETDSNEAMDVFRYFSLDSSGPEKAKLGQDLCRRLNLEGMTDQEGHSVNPLKQEKNRAGLACVAFLSRPWFKRLWIVQEIALARELELRCGSAAIYGSKFFWALQSAEWNARNIVGSLSNRLTARISWLSSLKRDVKDKRWTYHLSYVRLAHTFQAWDCGNDHDRLTALYGIAQTSIYGIAYRPEHTRQDPWFLPDYTILTMDLYYRFAKGYLQWNQQLPFAALRGLDILHYAGLGSFLASYLSHSSNHSWSCPSWIPDWRIRNRAEPLSSRNIFTTSGFDQRYRVNEISRTLTVCARPISRVSKVFQSVFSHTDGKIIQDIFALSERYTGDKMKEFVSAIVMDGRQSWTLNKDHLVKTFEEWKEKAEYAEKYQSGRLDETYVGSVVIDRVAATALVFCRNRSLFETCDGSIGVGPAHVKEGDSICMIHGLLTPFVVRKCTSDLTENSWILMGDCYVNGLMDVKWEASVLDQGQEITFV